MTYEELQKEVFELEKFFMGVECPSAKILPGVIVFDGPKFVLSHLNILQAAADAGYVQIAYLERLRLYRDVIKKSDSDTETGVSVTEINSKKKKGKVNAS